MSLIARASKIWASEGLLGLLGGVLRFARTPMRRLYYRADYYVHEFELAALDDDYPYPLPLGLEVHVIQSNEDANRLADCGYEDFRLVVPYSGFRLRSGAIGFCAYIDRRVVHTAWVGLTARAKRTFDPLPYAVDFDYGEGCSGGSWTFPAYRGRGIYRHVMWHRLWYLRKHGCTVCRDATEVGNTPGIKGQEVFSSGVVGRLRATCFLGVTRYSRQTGPYR